MQFIIGMYEFLFAFEACLSEQGIATFSEKESLCNNIIINASLKILPALL